MDSDRAATPPLGLKRPDDDITVSPIKIPSLTTRPEYFSSKTAISRSALATDVRSVPIFVLEDMMKALLPAVSANELERGIARLEEQNILKDGKWAGFPTEPKSVAGLEPAVFRPVETMIQTLCDDSAQIVFGSSPNASLQSNSADRESLSRPDAYLELRKSSWGVELENTGKAQRPQRKASSKAREESAKNLASQKARRWCNIAVPFEWKKEDRADRLLDVSHIPYPLRSTTFQFPPFRIIKRLCGR